MTHDQSSEPETIAPDDAEPKDDPRRPCARCEQRIDAADLTATTGAGSIIHAGCATPAPPCPDDVNPALWAEGAETLKRAPRESASSYELRLRIYAQIFGEGYERRKQAERAAGGAQ